MDPMSPIHFLADYALSSAASSASSTKATFKALKSSMLQSPFRTLRPSSRPSSRPSTPALSYKSSKSAGSSRSSRSIASLKSASKKTLLERGACSNHFTGTPGKPSKKSIADAISCINGKCGDAETVAADVPAAVSVKAPKAVGTKRGRSMRPMGPAVNAAALSKTKMAKIALAEVIVQKARLAVSEAKAALAVAEEDLEKIILN